MTRRDVPGGSAGRRSAAKADGARLVAPCSMPAAGRHRFPVTATTGNCVRSLWRGAAAIALLCLLGQEARAQFKPEGGRVEHQLVEIAATPIRKFSRLSDRRQFGTLTFLGGLVLTSPNKNFGGWSGLEIAPDGRKLVSISDAGTWLTGEIEYDGGTPKGVRNGHIGPLLAKGGTPLTRNRDRDAESVRLLDGSIDSGTLLIAFERNHRIGTFDIDGSGVRAPGSYLKMPPELKSFGRNSGLESVAVLKGGAYKGSVVAIAEGIVDSERRHTGWIWLRGAPQRFLVDNPGEFEITDAVSLDDGSMIVLARRFGWLEGVKMRLQRLPAAEIRPGAQIAGEVLLTADMSYDIDNMEGLAVHKAASGETVLTLLSDDNFNGFLQRTILLQFALSNAETQAARR